jgi:hypothetical protein
MRVVVLRAAAVVLLVAAVALGWLAFSRFGRAPAEGSSPAAQREFQQERLQEARLSVALGFAASVALFGALACLGAAGRVPAAQPPSP